MYSFTAIDFETATPKLDSACSIGIAAVKDLQIIQKEYYLIKPPANKYSAENTKIHGISSADTDASPLFNEVWPVLLNYITESSYIVAHNARFDLSVLFALSKTYGLDIPDFDYLDSISFSSKNREHTGRSLEECCKSMDVPLDNHHNALCDAVACAQLMIRAVELSRYKSFESYLKSYSSIPKKTYSELKPMKDFNQHKRHDNIKYSDIQPTLGNCASIDGVAGKIFVVTGELQCLSRADALQKIVDGGGIIKTSVGKKTDYLVVGVQDPKLVGEKGKSTKELKAQEINDNGGNIMILNEEGFKTLFNI